MSDVVQPRRDRTTVVVLASLAALALVLLAVGLPIAVAQIREADPTLDEVRAYEDLPTTHTGDDVDYDQSPPVGGRHDPRWAACGVYDEPLREENVVHDLEHGTVWITYRPGLDEDDVELLAERLPDDGILSPYPDQEAPVVVTVWGRQLELEGADDERLDLFLARFGNGETAPEAFASCAGGIDATIDGTEEEGVPT